MRFKGLRHVQSPHFSTRRGLAPRGTLVHGTGGGSAGSTIAWFKDEDSWVSAHFVIARSGSITQMVDTDYSAWHAGKAEMLFEGEAQDAVNRLTIGVEFANTGKLIRDGDDFFFEVGGKLRPYTYEQPIEASLVFDDGNTITGWWEPYSDEALDAFQQLRIMIRNVHGDEAAQNLQGHDEVAMPLGRKWDPGPLFPWERFSRSTKRRTSSIIA